MTTTPDPLTAHREELRREQLAPQPPASVRHDNRQDNTAYLEQLLDQINTLELQLAVLQSQHNLTRTHTLPADWYHTKTAIFRPHRDRATGKPTGRVEVLARRLQSGLVLTRHNDFWTALVDATQPTPEAVRKHHGEDSST